MKAAAMREHLTAFFDEIWNAGRVDSLERYIAPTYSIRSDPGDPWEGATLTRKQFKERIRISRAPFPDQRFEVVDMLVEGARIVGDWRWRGYDYEHGLFRGHRQQTDRLAIMQQLSAKT